MLTKEYKNKTTLPVPFFLIELTYTLIIFLVRRLRLFVKEHRNGSPEPQSPSPIGLGQHNVIGYFESECAAKLLTHLECELDCMETVKYALKNIDEQQGRLADMKIVVQEVERQVGKRFAQERRNKYS